MDVGPQTIHLPDWPWLSPIIKKMRTSEGNRKVLHGSKFLTPKNWCFWVVVLEKSFESPLDCKEIKPVHPKGDQPWIFIGRTGAEAPILWPPDVKPWLIGKVPDAGKGWGQEEKGATEDAMVGWHRWTQWAWVCTNSRRHWRTEACGATVHGATESDAPQGLNTTAWEEMRGPVLRVRVNGSRTEEVEMRGREGEIRLTDREEVSNAGIRSVPGWHLPISSRASRISFISDRGPLALGRPSAVRIWDGRGE